MEAAVGNFPTKSRDAALAEATSGARQREEEGLAPQGRDKGERSQTVGCVRLSHAVRSCCCGLVRCNELQCRAHVRYVVSVYTQIFQISSNAPSGPDKCRPFSL